MRHCDGKQRFESYPLAARVAKRSRRRRETNRHVYRREVKLLHCNSARAKDSNVRQALIDRFGGKEKAIGRKAAPGPLYSVKGDAWAALAVGLTADPRAAGNALEAR